MVILFFSLQGSLYFNLLSLCSKKSDLEICFSPIEGWNIFSQCMKTKDKGKKSKLPWLFYVQFQKIIMLNIKDILYN